MNKILFIIGLLTIVFNASAQMLPQGRFTEGLSGCTSCNLGEDGVLRFRFNPDTVDVVTETIEGVETQRLKLAIEAKITSNDAPLGWAGALSRVNYNEAAFGELINDNKCTFGRQSIFTSNTGTGTYSPRYRRNDSDTMALLETSAAAGLDPVLLPTLRPSYANLTNQFQTFLVMTCSIDNITEDAGFSFHGRVAGDNTARNFAAETRNGRVTVGRELLALADNDLRGFRLDGRTWVKDYARYGDGKGVRLEFSKNIATQLATGSFSLDTTDDTRISTVTHVVGTPYAEIEFSGEPIANDILKISTQTAIMDADGGALADGNFAAFLFYDAGAPRVIDFTQDNSTFTLTFSEPINPDFLSASDLCVTEPNGACEADEDDRTVPVLSVATPSGEMSPRMLTMVVDPSAGAKTGGMRSIEFRRNAVLLANNTPGQGD